MLITRNKCVLTMRFYSLIYLLISFNIIPLFKLSLYLNVPLSFPAPFRILSIFHRHLKLLSDFLIQPYDIVIEIKLIYLSYTLRCSITNIEKLFFLYIHDNKSNKILSEKLRNVKKNCNKFYSTRWKLFYQ